MSLGRDLKCHEFHVLPFLVFDLEIPPKESDDVYPQKDTNYGEYCSVIHELKPWKVTLQSDFGSFGGIRRSQIALVNITLFGGDQRSLIDQERSVLHHTPQDVRMMSSKSKRSKNERLEERGFAYKRGQKNGISEQQRGAGICHA